MDNTEIAKEIYKLINGEQDMGLKLLEFLRLTKESDVNKIIETYKKILNQEILITEIYSRDELDPSNKKALEAKIKDKYKNKTLVFDYDVSSKNKIGVMVKIGDNVLDGTF